MLTFRTRAEFWLKGGILSSSCNIAPGFAFSAFALIPWEKRVARKDFKGFLTMLLGALPINITPKKFGRVSQYPWFVLVCVQAAVWPGAGVSGQRHRLGNYSARIFI